jgi:transposase
MIMSAREQLKIDIVLKVLTGEFTREQGSSILEISDRTLRRYLDAYKTKGILFCKHGNYGNEPPNKTNLALKNQIISCVKEKYFDFNMLHSLEMLGKENLYVNRETFREWCHENNLVKHKKRRRTSKARYLRTRMEKTGILIQMDGSPHRWFDYKPSCLIAAIDDANSEFIHGEFFPSEDTISCMKVIQRIIEINGLFGILYVDRAGIFGGPKRTKFSQMKRALNELGIQIIFAQSPEAKGRIERLFNTTQDRLIPEMRFKDIRGYSNANNYLREVYIPEHNSKFKVQPRSLISGFKPVPLGVDLKEIFCLKERRRILNDHTFSWKGNFYALKSPTKFSIKGYYIEMRIYQDLTYKAFFAGKEIEITKVQIQRAA